MIGWWGIIRAWLLFIARIAHFLEHLVQYPINFGHFIFNPFCAVGLLFVIHQCLHDLQFAIFGSQNIHQKFVDSFGMSIRTVYASSVLLFDIIVQLRLVLISRVLLLIW